MRNVFLVLVLLNLGFAAWHLWFATGPQPTRSTAQTGPRIALAAETLAARGRSNDDTVTAPRNCISIGPFPNRVVITEITSRLGNAGYTAVQRVARGDVWLGYWVYIDAIPTQSDAAAIVADLSANGIADAYVIADGNRGSLVSLGVFSGQARADQRLAEARGLGYEPVIVDRSQPGDVYWLDVTADDDSTVRAPDLQNVVGQEALQFADCVER